MTKQRTEQKEPELERGVQSPRARCQGCWEWARQPEAAYNAASHFGLCPECHGEGTVRNVHKAHWFTCDQDQLRWPVGANLFSSWRDETEVDWQANVQLLRTYRTVEPHHPPEIVAWQPDEACDDRYDLYRVIGAKMTQAAPIIFHFGRSPAVVEAAVISANPGLFDGRELSDACRAAWEAGRWFATSPANEPYEFHKARTGIRPE